MVNEIQAISRIRLRYMWRNMLYIILWAIEHELYRKRFCMGFKKMTKMIWVK